MKPFEKKIWLSSPTMHGEELKYMTEAYETNWMSTVGNNVTEVEKLAAEGCGVSRAVALSSGTAALHMAVKLAGERVYGKPDLGHGCLEGRRVFCSDITFAATVNPVIYEGGVPVFIDTDAETWNMDPEALAKAFELYPEVKIVVYAELYGFPGRIDRIKEICEQKGALLIEDAAEALGAYVDGKPCGSFGDYGIISYNGNKIITGSSGGCLLTNDEEGADKALKWSTQAREAAPWYQHNEIGYNYRMSNVVAGVIRGQYLHLEEHIGQKKEIYNRYKEGLAGLPVKMNPLTEGTTPNYWLSCMIIDYEAMCLSIRTETTATYANERGKSCPAEILDALAAVNAEGRPIWKPMHLQPVFRDSVLVLDRGINAMTEEYINGIVKNKGDDIFKRGLCLPSDNKMTEEEVKKVIEVVKTCFEL